MALPYPNVTLPHEILQYVSGVTNNWWSIIVLIALFLAAYVSLGHIHPSKAFGGAMFFVSLVAGLFWYLSILTYFGLIITIVGLVLSIVLLVGSDRMY